MVTILVSLIFGDETMVLNIASDANQALLRRPKRSGKDLAAAVFTIGRLRLFQRPVSQSNHD